MPQWNFNIESLQPSQLSGAANFLKLQYPKGSQFYNQAQASLQDIYKRLGPGYGPQYGSGGSMGATPFTGGQPNRQPPVQPGHQPPAFMGPPAQQQLPQPPQPPPFTGGQVPGNAMAPNFGTAINGPGFAGWGAQPPMPPTLAIQPLLPPQSQTPVLGGGGGPAFMGPPGFQQMQPAQQQPVQIGPPAIHGGGKIQQRPIMPPQQMGTGRQQFMGPPQVAGGGMNLSRNPQADLMRMMGGRY